MVVVKGWLESKCRLCGTHNTKRVFLAWIVFGSQFSSSMCENRARCMKAPLVLWHVAKDHVCLSIYYRKRGSASYIVREVHSEREREREIQREKDGSDVTIVALKLAMSFALLLAKNVHLSIGDEFCAFPC